MQSTKEQEEGALTFFPPFLTSSPPPCSLQHLEQEKHELRRRFENKEGEWEGRVSELESDVKQLQDELERQQVHLREADREKTRAVQELSEQNQRLLDQLSRVSERWRNVVLRGLSGHLTHRYLSQLFASQSDLADLFLICE